MTGRQLLRQVLLALTIVLLLVAAAIVFGWITVHGSTDRPVGLALIAAACYVAAQLS